MQLEGKTALISGAGRNIGKAAALTFAREGADLILVAKARQDRLDQVAGECESLGAKVLPLMADVGHYDQVERVVKQGWERFGKVDILLNSTGIRPHKLPWEFSLEEWHEVFAVNLHAMFYFSRCLLPLMIERGKGGSIMAVGGMASFHSSGPKSAAHTSAKHGLYGLIKTLAHVGGPHNIRANLINPGVIDSERLNPEWYPGGTSQTPAAIKATPLGRFGTMQEVANVALFLASDMSSYITGDAILCTGGQNM